MKLLAVLFVFTSALALGAATEAQAQEFDCLLRAKGKVVRWDKDWQKDLSDHDVPYRIEDVTDLTTPFNPKTVQLNLKALTPANQPKRKATIIKLLAARLFCDRLGEYQGNQVALTKGEVEERSAYFLTYSASAVVPADLSYRVWSEGSWKTARATEGQPLFVCQTQTVAVACNRHDFEWLRSQDRGASDISWVKLDLKLPFIRYSNVGWVRDLPIGNLRGALVTTCILGNKKYACLAEEKTRYGSQLPQVEAELEAQVKMAQNKFFSFSKPTPSKAEQAPPKRK